MSKIDLDPITSGYNLSKINANFQKVEDELNNKVLYRDSPAGEPNSMSSNLDMNSRSILNANKISSNVLELGGVQVVPTSLATDPYNGTREALRRSYAEAGYNLVDGSFEVGGVLVNANDVLLQEHIGKAFSGPAGVVAAGTDPASGSFVDVSKFTSTDILFDVFGAKGDGVTNDYQAIKNAYASGATSLKGRPGAIYLINPPTAQLSDAIEIASFQKTDWGGASIISNSGAKSLFTVRCRSTDPLGSAFRQGIAFKNVRLGSTKASTSDNAWEYEHLIYIQGGWINGFSFTDYVASPRLGIRSAIHFDLTGSGEIGVPDTTGDGIKNMNFQYAYNTSSIVSMVGTSPASARLGQVDIDGLILGCISARGFDGTSTGVRAAVYIEEVACRGSSFTNIYGPRGISMTTNASIEGGIVKRIYNEIDNYLDGALIAIGTAPINGGTLKNTEVACVRTFVDSLVIPIKPGTRRLINSKVVNCDIKNLGYTDPRNDFNMIASDCINLLPGSTSVCLDKVETSISSLNDTDGFQHKITSPQNCIVEPRVFGRVLRKINTIITSDTITTLIAIPESSIEMRDIVKVRIGAVSGTGSVKLRISSAGLSIPIESVVIDTALGVSSVDLDLLLEGTSGSRFIAANTRCSGIARAYQNGTIKGANYVPSIYTKGSDVNIEAVTSGGTSNVRIDSVTVSIEKGTFFNAI